jgi:hypothetical protein
MVRMSKTFGLLISVIFINVILISGNTNFVYAQTLKKDLGQKDLTELDVNFNQVKYCSFDVSVTIQTEPDGNWVVNHTYEVNWLVTITNLSQSQYKDSQGFNIVFDNLVDPIVINSSADKSVVQNITKAETTVTLHNNGTLSMTLTPETGTPAILEFNTVFSYHVFQTIPRTNLGEGTYKQNQPINITIENGGSLSPQPKNSLSGQIICKYVIVIAFVGLLLVVLVLLKLLKKHRKTSPVKKL